MGIKVVTKPFGEIEIEEAQIINFPEGIFGFDDIHKFVILDSHEKSPFKWLQAWSEPDLAFVVIRPQDFLVEYELVVSQNDIEFVEAESVNELLVYAIVRIPSNPSEMTANLQGPIIINPKNKTGKQAISLSEKYGVRHRILDEIKATNRDRDRK